MIIIPSRLQSALRCDRVSESARNLSVKANQSIIHDYPLAGDGI